jgi:glycosyltransferase involved in cell wall biosynthesis
VAQSSPIGSVVIPAHNEAGVIRRCLDALLVGCASGELDVVVSCNGCTDDTADIVRSTWPTVRVIEMTQASKVGALRAADETLSVFPRLYLDADVVLSAMSARLVIDRLRTDSVLAARPPISYDTSGADLLVRSYYRARARVPSLMNSLWGAGVYGLSAAGRARFGPFPDVIADDMFVDQQFKRSEIEIIDSEPVIVTVPQTTRYLFRILRRTYRGNAENRALSGGQENTTSSTLRGLVPTILTGPAAVADAVTYVGIAVVARIPLSVSSSAGWERDESSRGIPG